MSDYIPRRPTFKQLELLGRISQSTAVISLTLMIAVFYCSNVSAALVHISVDRRGGTEFGAGYTVARDGTQCFVITPLHVVELASPDDITVTDSEGRSSGARIVKESTDFDAALLELTGSTAIDCIEDWQDGSGTQVAVSEAPFLVARKVDDSGRVSQSRLFTTSNSREFIELEPYGQNVELREGDSGSSLYAGNTLVGMVTEVDTSSGRVTAITQGQLHGLFGADVLKQELKTVAVTSFVYRGREHPYAAIGAREFVSDHESIELVELPESQPPESADVTYLISGELLTVSRKRDSNPDYERPQEEERESNFARRLLDQLEEGLEEQLDAARGKNTEARYLSTYSIDIDVRINDLQRNSSVRELVQNSIVIPEMGASSTEMQNAAIRDAVNQSLLQVFNENEL